MHITRTTPAHYSLNQNEIRVLSAIVDRFGLTSGKGAPTPAVVAEIAESLRFSNSDVESALRRLHAARFSLGL